MEVPASSIIPAHISQQRLAELLTEVARLVASVRRAKVQFLLFDDDPTSYDAFLRQFLEASDQD